MRTSINLNKHLQTCGNHDWRQQPDWLQTYKGSLALTEKKVMGFNSLRSDQIIVKAYNNTAFEPGLDVRCFAFLVFDYSPCTPRAFSYVVKIIF